MNGGKKVNIYWKQLFEKIDLMIKIQCLYRFFLTNKNKKRRQMSRL